MYIKTENVGFVNYHNRLGGKHGQVNMLRDPVTVVFTMSSRNKLFKLWYTNKKYTNIYKS